MRRLHAPLLALGFLTLLAPPPAAAADAFGDPLPPGAVARLGTVRLQHTGGVTALAFAPDGKTLATGGHDRTVRLWEIATGRELQRFLGHKEAIMAVVFSRDCKTLVSGSKEGGIVLWDAATGRKVRSVFHPSQPLVDLVVSPDGSLLVSAGGRSLTLWELPVGRFLRPLTPDFHGGQRVTFSPDGKRLGVVGWRAGLGAVIDVATGKQMGTFAVPPGGDGALDRAAFAGKLLIASDTRSKVHIYDAGTGKLLRSLKAGHFALASCLACSPDGKLLACGGDPAEATLRVYDATTGREQWRRRDPLLPQVAAFSPDGRLLATSGADGKVRFWDPASGKPVHSVGGHDGPVVRVCLTGDGNTVLTAGVDGTVRVWDRATGKERRSPISGWGTLSYLGVTPDGKTLAAWGEQCLPCLFDLTRNAAARGDAVQEFPKDHWITLSPDGTHYARYPGRQVAVYERATGREIARRAGAIPYLIPVLSPDNTLFAATWGERDADVLDIRTGRRVMNSKEGAVEVRRALAFSPDSKLLASASDKRGIELWDLARKQRTKFPREKQEPCHTVAFSPDGSLLAWDGTDATVCLGDLATGKERLRIRGHDGPVTGIAFTADRRFLISSSRDGTALVWDLPGLLRAGQPPAKQNIARAPQPPRPTKDGYGDPLPEGATARMGTARWRLPGGARTIGFTPDSKGLIVNPNTQREGPLHVLDLATGKELTRLKGAMYFDQVYGLSSFSIATGGNLLAVGYGGRVDLWEFPAGRLLRQINAAPSQIYFALAPDGKTVATGGGADKLEQVKSVRLWDVASGRLLATLDGHQTPVTALTFSADGKRLLSSSPKRQDPLPGKGFIVHPGSVRVWDVAARKQLAQYPNESHWVVFSPDGLAWAYQGGDNRIHLVDADGKDRAQLTVQANSFTFTPDGKALATAAADQPVQLWDAVTGKPLRSLEGRLGTGFPNLRFSPDGRTLACASQTYWATPGGTVRLWDVASGKEFRPHAVHQDKVTCVAPSADGAVIASGSKDGSLFLWDAASGKALHRLADHKNGVTAVAFGGEGKLLASAGKDGGVCLWRVADAKELRRFQGTGGSVLTLTFAADGKSLWACGEKGTVEGWDVASGAPAGRSERATKAIGAAAFSPGGDMLAYVAGVANEFSGSTTVHVCRPASGKELLKLDLRDPGTAANMGGFIALHCWAVAFSPDGRLLATSESIQTQGLRFILSNHTIRVWEIATGKQVLQLTGLAVPTHRLAFSSDGRLLAHGHGQMMGWGHGSEQVVLLRDLSAGENLQQVITEKREVMCQQSGVQLRPLGGHVGQVSIVGFAPGGKRVVTGGDDGTLLTWDVAAFAPGAGPRPNKVTALELQTFWERLAATDAALGYQAIGRLEVVPGQALPFLKERLKPAPAADMKRVPGLIADLEDRSFAVRQKAFNELAAYAEQAEDALRKAKIRSLEGQRRVQQLLDRVDRVGLSAEQLRTQRVLTLLERIGTPEARRLLEALAAGAPTRLTREARTSLARWPH